MTDVLEKLMRQLYPSCCRICGKIMSSDNLVCSECHKELDYLIEPVCKKCGKKVISTEQEYCFDCSSTQHFFEQNRGVFEYKGQIKSSIYNFKYKNKRKNADFYIDEIISKCGKWIRRCDVDCLIPIPIHESRKRQRGYNQSKILADGIAKEFNIPVYDNILSRQKKTLPQKQLNNNKRKNNLKNAFRIESGVKQIESKRIMIVDDIYTTGSTIDEAALSLKHSGAKTVFSITVCIGDGY